MKLVLSDYSDTLCQNRCHICVKQRSRCPEFAFLLWTELSRFTGEGHWRQHGRKARVVQGLACFSARNTQLLDFLLQDLSIWTNPSAQGSVCVKLLPVRSAISAGSGNCCACSPVNRPLNHIYHIYILTGPEPQSTLNKWEVTFNDVFLQFRGKEVTEDFDSGAAFLKYEWVACFICVIYLSGYFLSPNHNFPQKLEGVFFNMQTNVDISQ